AAGGSKAEAEQHTTKEAEGEEEEEEGGEGEGEGEEEGADEAGMDKEAGSPTAWKVDWTVTATVLQTRRFAVPQLIITACWPSAQMPVPLTVGFVLDGASCGARGAADGSPHKKQRQHAGEGQGGGTKAGAGTAAAKAAPAGAVGQEQPPQPHSRRNAAAPATRFPTALKSEAAPHEGLAALALQRIGAPPDGASNEAIAVAVCAAFAEVERAAVALGLPLADLDAVCAGVQAATEAPAEARRFLAMEYRRLWRACEEGNAKVVREWMARAVARGGGGSGGGGGG
ncbi:hypothetical protein Rsub_13343, partial [Raphidocelis subcapitata]